MASAGFCPYCGRPLVPGAAFCPSCGAAQPTAGYLGSGAPPTPGAPPPMTFAGAAASPVYVRPFGSLPPVPRAPADLKVEDEALGDIALAALLGLIGVILGFVSLFVSPSIELAGAAGTGASSGFSISLGSLYALIGLGAIGIVLTLLELWFYRRGFHALAAYDDRFSTPASLVLVLLVALVLVLVIGAGLLYSIYEAILCAGVGNPITTACINGGQILSLAALLVVILIVAFVGYIGLLLGVWRLGTRYNDGTFKVAAVLLIIPLLDIVGVILVLVAARSARDKLGAAGPPLGGSFG